MTDLDSEYYIAQCAEKDIEIERNRAAIAELLAVLKEIAEMDTDICGYTALAAIAKHTTTTKEGN